MNIKDVDWELGLIGGCGVFTPQTREAVKAAQNVLAEVRNLLDLPATADVKEIARAVTELKGY